MNELALFAGAGGGLLASNLLGHTVVCAVERDEFCIEVLIQRQNERNLPQFPIWDDICTFDGRPWHGTVDLVSGGFPCQAFSPAARGRNITEKNIWYQMRRVIREVRPPLVFAENVSKRAILQAKQDLEADDFVCEWTELSAKDLGADHIRERFWLLAHSNNNGKLLGTINAKTRMLPELCNGVWETFPNELRVDDGVANRMDRLKAIGNGQVPIVAATAFTILLNRLLMSEQIL